MSSPFNNFTKKDWILLVFSVSFVALSNAISAEFDLLTCIAALLGVVSLVFAAKGNIWAPILMIFFSIMYGIISWRFHYWGEMITYLGMTLPMEIWSTYTWWKNPSKENENEVEVASMTGTKWMIVGSISVVVTAVFYFVLKAFDTPNLIVSTISITTSFAAAALTMLRSSYYALFYAMNDIVLIILWVLASVENPVYIPVVVNFSIFLMNDIYGFVCWKKREYCDADPIG